MIAPGSSGFYGAPATKVLLCHAVITYFLFAFPLQHFQHLFYYRQDVFAKRQLKKMLASKLVFLDLPDLVFTAVLFYNFRIFERRFGTRKYVSHLIGTTLLACGLELLVFAVLNQFEVNLGMMPSGLLSTAFPLFIPFFSTIPRVAVMRVMGVPVTGKTFNYIMGLQVASSGVETMLVAAIGLLSGLLWRANILGLPSLLRIPLPLAKTVHACLGALLDGPDSQRTELPMGATLELQNQERMDRLEQQMMASALAASQRVEIGRPQPMNIAPGPGIFGAVGRTNLGQGDQVPNSGNPAETETTISEEQVRNFVEMGFTDSQARDALRTANNNPRLATDMLLQGVQ